MANIIRVGGGGGKGGFSGDWENVVTATAAEAISKDDPVVLMHYGDWEEGVNNLAQPSTIPKERCHNIIMNRQGTMIAVAVGSSATTINLYEVTGTTVTFFKTLTTSTRAYAMCFSADGKYLYYGGYPDAAIHYNDVSTASTATIVACAASDASIDTATYGMDISPDGSTMAIGHTRTVELFTVNSNGTLTHVANAGTIGGNSSYDITWVRFHPNGKFLYAGYASSIFVLSISGTTTSLIQTVSLGSTTNYKQIYFAINPAGTYLFADDAGSATAGAPIMYSIASTGKLTAVTMTSPGAYSLRGCAFTPSGHLIAFYDDGSTTGILLYIYKETSNGFQKIANPTVLPGYGQTTTGSKVASNLSNNIFAVACATSPYLYVYRQANQAAKEGQLLPVYNSRARTEYSP